MDANERELLLKDEVDAIVGLILNFKKPELEWERIVPTSHKTPS